MFSVNWVATTSVSTRRSLPFGSLYGTQCGPLVCSSGALERWVGGVGCGGGVEWRRSTHVDFHGTLIERARGVCPGAQQARASTPRVSRARRQRGEGSWTASGGLTVQVSFVDGKLSRKAMIFFLFFSFSFFFLFFSSSSLLLFRSFALSLFLSFFFSSVFSPSLFLVLFLFLFLCICICFSSFFFFFFFFLINPFFSFFPFFLFPFPFSFFFFSFFFVFSFSFFIFFFFLFSHPSPLRDTPARKRARRRERHGKP